MLINTYELTIKKSKFIGYLYEIKDEEDAKKILESIKEKHKKASHFPYAYVLNNTARKSDDKEPHDSAGMPIYNQLIYNDLKKHLLVIVRYFGGIKLGVGNLLRTYLKVAKNTISKE